MRCPAGDGADEPSRATSCAAPRISDEVCPLYLCACRDRSPPAGVSVTTANHIRFEKNIFTQMGATGLDFVSGTHDDMIIGNVVTEIAGNGTSIGKFAASDTTESPPAPDPFPEWRNYM
jgi:hypothetical protein